MPGAFSNLSDVRDAAAAFDASVPGLTVERNVGRCAARTALFVVSIYNYHREVEPVIEQFCAAGWRTIVIIGWLGPAARTAAARYRDIGCEVILPPAEMCYPMLPGETASDGAADQAAGMAVPPGATRGETLRARARRLARRWVRSGSVAERVMSLPGLVAMFRRRRAYGRTLLARARPDVVLFGPFQGIGTLDNALFNEAGRRGIPRCCYPVSAYHGRANVRRARLANLRAGMVDPILWCDHDGLNRLLARLFPHWVAEEEGKRFFFVNPTVLAAAALTGTTRTDLFQKPDPGFDRVFVFTDFSRRLLDDGTFPMERVEICGIPLLDPVVVGLDDPSHRRTLFAALGLAHERPFLLFNVEPSAEHHYADWQTHWRNFHSMMRVVSTAGLPVVLSLHPLCRPESYLFAEEQYGVVIARAHKIYDLYPYCAFAVSFPCSTNIVAEIFDKPLIIYDFHDMASETSRRAAEFRLPNARVGATPEAVAALIAAAKHEIGATTSPHRSTGEPASLRLRRSVERLVATEPSRRRASFAGARRRWPAW